MARINIEECWWSDPRRSKLIRLLGGDTRTADGLAIEAWRLAQEFWKHNRTLIPRGHFEALEGQEFLVKAGLAEIKGDEVYVRGSSQYLEWLHEEKLSRKLGGRISAQRSRDERGRLLSQGNQDRPAETQQAPSCPPTGSSSIQLSVSGSLSGSNTKNQESIGETAIAICPEPGLPEIPKKKPPRPEIGRFIGVYVKAFQVKYPPKEGGTLPRPDLRGKTQGQIKRYLDEIPIDRACDLIQAYCQMDDPWFKTKCHDFGTFIENQNKISLALDRGEDNSQPGSHIDWSKFA